MTKEMKLNMLIARRNTLEGKGPHNNAIVKKLNRKIRQLSKSE
jgi:hypothetical protein